MNGSDQLPSPDFDSQNYARPNDNWICGHAADGKPCGAGPDRHGRCQATAECRPVLDLKAGETKGRWRCTRSGGVCDNGPSPDGVCGRPLTRCSPVPTLRMIRGRVTRLVVAATVAFLLILLGSARWRSAFVNPGDLSAAHAGEVFARRHSETNGVTPSCAACHAAGAAGPAGLVNAAAGASPGVFNLRALMDTERADVTRIDAACQRCHAGHAFHQPNVVRDVSCSFCHVEHRGPGPMPLPTDAHCAICHGNANLMTASAALRTSANGGRERSGTPVITQFAGDHPGFRVHTENWQDSNPLRFGHALHLTGGTIPPLPDGRRLDCTFCHEPDASGSYFRPVRFENHCRACHSLQFDPTTPELVLPHGSPEFVTAFLQSLPRQYSDHAIRSGIPGAAAQREYVQQKLRELQQRSSSAGEFERRIFFSTATIGPATQVGTVSGTTRALYPGCAYCHEVKPGVHTVAEIVPPKQTERWLAGSPFNHATHAPVACTECHSAQQSRVTSDIILPRKESCVTCHSPRGGASYSCITCHTFHNFR